MGCGGGGGCGVESRPSNPHNVAEKKPLISAVAAIAATDDGLLLSHASSILLSASSSSRNPSSFISIILSLDSLFSL